MRSALIPPRSPRFLVALGVLALTSGCRGCDSQGRGRPGATVTTASATTQVAPALPPSRVLVDLVRALPECDVEHRGPLLDAGTEATLGRFGWGEGRPAGVTSVEHDGSTWARITERSIN